MPATVAAVIKQFLATAINPSPETTSLAIATRQRLFAALEQLIIHAPGFPALAPQHLDVSPIFRKTEIRPLQQGLAHFFRGVGTTTLATDSTVMTHCADALTKIEKAGVYESQGELSAALTLWQQVFGARFPG